MTAHAKPQSSDPRCIRQPRVKAEQDQSPRFIRDKQLKSLDPFRCDTELLYSRVICLHTERPQAQHPPTSTHYYESTSPPEVCDLLVSDALWYHHREAQNHSPEHSHSPFLDGGIIFPPLSGMLDPCQSSSNN